MRVSARDMLVVVVFLAIAPFDVKGFSPQSEVVDFPYPPANYGQYNSPITQEDMEDSRSEQQDSSSRILTREIRIRQGRLRGVVRQLKNRKLQDVEVFLGVPYAAPPMGPLRFMPPGSPPTWPGLRTFQSFGPVCPQVPPNLTHEPLNNMNAGRYNHLKGLLPFLRNQSEDCLYLNIYSPIPDKKSLSKFPVMVFVHGESYEWNSGNPYDGSVLASYGGVVVVTINFRLGILGFLRPGISGHTVSNFGLLDQIAALQWVKDNIAEFRGDVNSVTLLGHGTGAACVNFLMVSPVSLASEGLFHRAILMSGTALSDWALTVSPLQYTIQVAEALNCPVVEENDQLSNCLRKKRLSEIMAVKIRVPQFQTPFGPLVDGSVVPNTPEMVMGVYKNLFTRYDMLYGVTEWESYHSLNAVSLAYGMLERERDELLRRYMHSKYEVLPDLALATTLSEYSDWTRSRTMDRAAAEQHRDVVLHILSDARVTAPLVQMALYHSSTNPRSYMYVFQHNNKFGEFAGMERSVAGEELPYVFGIPLSGEESPLSHHTFSLPEQLLSEAIITHFTNFAKTGNPNAPHRADFLSQSPREWLRYDLDWPEFEAKNRSYMSLRIPPHIGQRYRQQMTDYWNKVLPDLLSNPSTRVKPPKTDLDSIPEMVYEPTERPRLYGSVRTHSEEAPPRGRADIKDRVSGQMDRPVEGGMPTPKPDRMPGNTLYIVFSVVGAAFLLVNMVAFALLYYKKQRLQSEAVRLHQLTEDLDDGGFRDRMQRDYDVIDPRVKVEEWIEQEVRPEVNEWTEPETVRVEEKKKVQKVEKVSVAVDATPSTRSASVLKQTPIELIKALKLSRSSISLDSEAATTREILLRPETLPEDPLKNIQRRNFPKVLPDLPKRLSLPPSAMWDRREPPPPPPRVSTLDRAALVKPSEDPPLHTSSAVIKLKTPKTIIVANKPKPVTRHEPSVVIQSVTGPVKPEVNTKVAPHVNVQTEPNTATIRRVLA